MTCHPDILHHADTVSKRSVSTIPRVLSQMLTLREACPGQIRAYYTEATDESNFAREIAGWAEATERKYPGEEANAERGQ